MCGARYLRISFQWLGILTPNYGRTVGACGQRLEISAAGQQCSAALVRATNSVRIGSITGANLGRDHQGPSQKLVPTFDSTDFMCRKTGAKLLLARRPGAVGRKSHEGRLLTVRHAVREMPEDIAR